MPTDAEKLGAVLKLLEVAHVMVDDVRTHLTPPEPPSTVIDVPAGASIQAALNALPGSGDYVVTLAAGTVYAENLIFPVRAGATTLMTKGFAVPAGTRVSPADVATMATIIGTDGLLPVIGFAWASHDIILCGINVPGNATHPDRTTIAVGLDPITWGNPRTLADLPTWITFDRIYMNAEATGGRQAIRADGIDVQILDSYIAGFWLQGQDSQAIGMINGAGPLLVRNCFLEASGENFMAGGSDPAIHGLISSDLTFVDNTFFKPQHWRQKPGSVKNLFELKNAQRVVVRRNTFDGVWSDGQSGNAIVFTPRNQDGGAPWCQVRDVLFEDNVLQNVENFAFNILGCDDLNPSATTTHLRIRNNLIHAAGNGALLQAPMDGVEFAHNTFVTLAWKFLAMDTDVTGFSFRDNVVPSGAYGITGDGTTGNGTPSLEDNVVPPYTFAKNLIEQPADGWIAYPDGNYLVAAGTLAGLFNTAYAITDPAYLGSDGAIVGIDATKLPPGTPGATVGRRGAP